MAEIRRLLAEVEPVLPGEVENETAVKLLRWWAEAEPAAAIEYAVRRPALHGRPGLVGELFVGWLDRQPAEALGWARALVAGDLRDQVLPPMISLLAAKEPLESLRLAAELPADRRAPALSALFAEWGVADPARAAQEAMQLKDPGEQNLALRQVMGKWMDRDPDVAIAWARQRPPEAKPDSEDVLPSVVGLVVEKWAARSPADAADYVVGLPPAPGRPQLLTTVIMQWAGSDPSAAVGWASRLPDPAARSVAVREIVGVVAETNFRRAAELAAGLPPPAGGDDGLRLVAERWQARDPAGLKDWLNRVENSAVRVRVAGLLGPK